MLSLNSNARKKNEFLSDVNTPVLPVNVNITLGYRSSFPDIIVIIVLLNKTKRLHGQQYFDISPIKAIV